MFDTICKFLIETFPSDFASWLIGEPVSLTELSPSELSLEPIGADALMLWQSTEMVLHVEFQSRPDPNMPFRMADYRLRTYRRFPHKLMKQVVVYLKETVSEDVFRTTFEISGLRHEFEVIRLWEQPVDVFLSEPGLLPFAALGQTSDRAAVLQQVARRIEAIPDRRTQQNILASTGILAG
ncbi:MAG: Rpn family recombination-promoting nuclease/putative transposase, partial [Moorea sp. SIO3C2]|nr:Rpn family recombination-promoting nuclease/putative transposase [Moorena sp. SIO3C2]